MAKIDEITLIGTAYSKDALKQFIATPSRRTVLCTIGSITASEFFEAGRNGLRPQFRANVFVGDYQGEVEAEYQGLTYGIYRTYCPKDDTVELYLERKAGS